MKNKGISLIVLIITIIVVIILAVTVILTLSKNNPIESAREAKILSSLHNVNDSIELYKSKLQMSRLMDDINVDTLIEDGVLKEYIIEETLRPIAVIEDYKKLGINGKFGSGYKNIPEETFEGEVSVKKENLNDVCAIDLTDYTLYYIQNEKVYNLNGVSISDNILSNFERYNADTSEWTFDEKTQTLTRYNGDLTQKRGEQEVGEVIIPNYYNGKRVKTFAVSFNKNESLTKLKISDGIESISSWGAFWLCTNLKGDLIIPDSIREISDYAFSGCTSLNGILKISKNLKIINTSLFNGCSNLKGNIIIPDETILIGNNAFYGCKALNGKLMFGSSLKEIGSNCFYDCNNLSGDLIIPDNVEILGSGAFRNCYSFDGKLYLSKNINIIRDATFYNCNKLKGDLIIPDNVEIIENAAFYECSSLNGKLDFGKGIKEINGWGTFGNCVNLKGDVILPETLEKIESAFVGTTSLNSFSFFNRETIFADSSYVLPNNAKIIGYSSSTAEAYAIKYNRNFEEIQ